MRGQNDEEQEWGAGSEMSLDSTEDSIIDQQPLPPRKPIKLCGEPVRWRDARSCFCAAFAFALDVAACATLNPCLAGVATVSSVIGAVEVRESIKNKYKLSEETSADAAASRTWKQAFEVKWNKFTKSIGDCGTYTKNHSTLANADACISGKADRRAKDGSEIDDVSTSNSATCQTVRGGVTASSGAGLCAAGMVTGTVALTLAASLIIVWGVSDFMEWPKRGLDNMGCLDSSKKEAKPATCTERCNKGAATALDCCFATKAAAIKMTFGSPDVITYQPKAEMSL